MTAVPSNIRDQVHSLTPDELLTLIKVEIFPADNSTPIVLYLSERDDVVFNGVTYSSATFALLGAGQDSGGEKTRPRLQLPNPQGMFSVFAQNGDLEMARVDRLRVHPLDVNTNNAIIHSWYVSRIEIVNSSMIVLELAALSDGPKVRMPYREYVAPEFKSVSL